MQLLAYLLRTTILLTKKKIGSGMIMGPHFICTGRKRVSVTLLFYNIIITNTLNLISPSDDVLLIIFIWDGKRFIFT